MPSRGPSLFDESRDWTFEIAPFLFTISRIYYLGLPERLLGSLGLSVHIDKGESTLFM
jgi:hypothetical protein